MLQNPEELRTPIPPAPPMPWPGADHPPPAEMTVAELGAAVAALPGMRDALREAFDRLAACSPTPLPFAWVDLDAHVSSLQSSISLRFRQVRALEAARAAPAAAAPGGSRGDRTRENLEEEEVVEEKKEEAVEVDEEVVEEEEVVEVEEEVVEEEEEEVVQEQEGEEVFEVEVEKVVEVEEFVAEEEEKGDEEMQEADSEEADDEIGKDGKDEKKAREVLQENKVVDLADDRFGNDTKVADEQSADEEMQVANEQMQSTEQVANEEMQSTEDADKSSQDKEHDPNMEEGKTTEGTKVKEEDANMEDEQDIDMDEALNKNASAMPCEEEACGVKQEEEEDLEAHKVQEGAKNGMLEETTVANEMSLDQGCSLPVGFNDHTAACANMDALRLVKLLFTNTGLNSELHAALHRAPDAAALALHMVELFLHDKMLKTNKAWVNCVGLIRMVPVVVTKLSADTIEQAKLLAKDWKEMIDNSENCTVLGNLASWGFLYFLISYNIVSEFETKEIFRLFGTMPRKQQKMNYAMLLKGLQLTDRIPELMDYLIENGQQVDVLYWARIFNLVDKYPPVSLLKGYIEKAKQTAIEISQKNMTSQSLSVVIKELDNLRRAQDLADQHITDSSLSTSIKEEINNLLWEFGKRKQSLAKRSLAKSCTASTLKSKQQHTEGNKKHKEEGHHEGQESQQQWQQSKPGEKLEKKLDKPQQKQQQQQKHEYKPHDKQQQSKKQKQSKKQHAKQLRQHTPKLPARASPAAQNAPLRGHFRHPPYVATNGVYSGYPAQPGGYCVPLFAPQLGAPENIGFFNPFYPHPEFYP